MSKLKDLTGQKFGKLIVIEYIGKSYWLCKCECGNICKVQSNNLKNGHTKSCGCLKWRVKHSISYTRIYRIYYNMKQRCYNPKNVWYKNYGLRNISICDEWLNDVKVFYNWSINNGYKDNLSIDRIDVNGNYEPNNCRWVNRKMQQNNMRRNKKFTFKNKTFTGSEWARILNITPTTFYNKLRNHTFEQIIYSVSSNL